MSKRRQEGELLTNQVAPAAAAVLVVNITPVSFAAIKIEWKQTESKVYSHVYSLISTQKR